MSKGATGERRSRQNMYNRLYKYLSQQNLLFERLRGFETAHSTEHTTAELANK